MAGELKILKEAIQITDAITSIKKECKPFLKHKTMLYRGMTAPKNIGIEAIRKDRNPTGSPEYQKFLGELFKKWKLPLRRESMFCSPHTSDSTEIYGDRYMVFPRGNFNFVWFTDIGDMFDGDPEIVQEHEKAFEIMDMNIDPEKKLDMLVEWVESIDDDDPQTEDVLFVLSKLQDKNFETTKFPPYHVYEMAITGKDFYYIKYDDDIDRTIRNEFGIK
jgi:hypothetical protein